MKGPYDIEGVPLLPQIGFHGLDRDCARVYSTSRLFVKLISDNVLFNANPNLMNTIMYVKMLDVRKL
jgi:hypothetical protein